MSDVMTKLWWEIECHVGYQWQEKGTTQDKRHDSGYD